ncbi:MAG: hypothetical protein AB7L13_23880 [Acidimicrobiia bacterium]
MSDQDDRSLRDAIGLPRRRQRPLPKGLVMPHPATVGDLWTALENYPPTWDITVELSLEWEAFPPLHLRRLIPISLNERLILLASGYRKGIDE